MVGLAAQLRERSEDDADDELLSVAIVKHGSKAVTGSQTGVLSLYSWGYSKDCSDRFPGVSPVAACCNGLACSPRYCRVACRMVGWTGSQDVFCARQERPAEHHGL